MRPLLSPEQMVRCDEAAILAGTPAPVLMARAGRALCRAVVRSLGRTYGSHVAVVCGPGSNGGDGFVAALALARRGAGVTCFAAGDLSSTKGAARFHLDALRLFGVHVRSLPGGSLPPGDAIVDAVFGTGFRGPAGGEAARAIESMNGSPCPVIAADIPSGVDGATGATEGEAVRADSTVAMQCEKWGTATGRGAALAGRLEVADIGISLVDSQVAMVERTDVAAALPHRPPDAHKRSGGAVALLAGSDALTGAAVLCAQGAVRAGAGYATVGATPLVRDAISARLPEVLSTLVSSETVLGPGALGEFSGVLERADALVLGPGLGRGDAQRALVTQALATVSLPLALDADGLNLLAGDTGALRRRTGPTVITPHPAEMGRLLGTDVRAVQANRLEAARSAAHRCGCVVVLKGHRTVVANDSGRAYVVPTGGPELATAGTGDVLAGLVAAFLAAGLEPFTSAWAGAFVHGLAGSIAASRRGASSVLAGDVAGSIGEALDLVEA